MKYLTIKTMIGFNYDNTLKHRCLSLEVRSWDNVLVISYFNNYLFQYEREFVFEL